MGPNRIARCSIRQERAVIFPIRCNEYPQLVPRKWFDEVDYDGVFEENMTICVESHIGKKGGHEAVRLEEMVRITETGCELVGKFSFEEELLS